MAIPKLKATGVRGSWFANVDGDSLPCVHEHWTRISGGKMLYDDPGCHPDDITKWSDFLAALDAKKRVILTRDKTDDGKNFDRQGYIGVFRIGDIEVSAGHLRFQFLERLANLS